MTLLWAGSRCVPPSRTWSLSSKAGAGVVLALIRGCRSISVVSPPCPSTSSGPYTDPGALFGPAMGPEMLQRLQCPLSPVSLSRVEPAPSSGPAVRDVLLNFTARPCVSGRRARMGLRSKGVPASTPVCLSSSDDMYASQGMLLKVGWGRAAVCSAYPTQNLNCASSLYCPCIASAITGHGGPTRCLNSNTVIHYVHYAD